ncbi:hypothetical protein FB451DRAFT_1416525 [Mycena latifolia]|nr:hypothetical protein FB451DRAFT_1416525 [Mycena latifolia]
MFADLKRGQWKYAPRTLASKLRRRLSKPHAYGTELELDRYSGPGTGSDMSDLGLGGAYGAPSPLRSFASLSSDLVDLELDMELAPEPSPSRRSATPLPALPGPRSPLHPQFHGGAHGGPAASTGTRPRECAGARPSPTAALPPSPLDMLMLGPAARLPPGVPPRSSRCSWRSRPHTRACHCEYERRWGHRKGGTGVRAAAERAAGRGGAAEAQVSERVGKGGGGAGGACAGGVADVSTGNRCLFLVLRLHFRLCIVFAGVDDLAKQKKRRGEKAEKAGLASVRALIARMILRRRERCVRRLRKGRGRASGGSPLRCALTLNAEGAEGGEPPPMEVAPLPSMEPPPMELVLSLAPRLDIYGLASVCLNALSFCACLPACLLAYTYHIFPTPLHSILPSISTLRLFSPFSFHFSPLSLSLHSSSCYLLLHLISFLLSLLHPLFTAAFRY